VTGLSFGGVAASFTFINDGSVTAVAPSGLYNAQPVTVTTPAGTSNSGVFSYPPPPPTITGCGPCSSPVTGTTTIVINGTNFINVTHVKINTVDVAFTANSTTSITVLSTPPGPAGPMRIDVVADGGTATDTTKFSYTP
jgi:hypothetical protein